MLHVFITDCTSDFFCTTEHTRARAVVSTNVCKNICVRICITEMRLVVVHLCVILQKISLTVMVRTFSEGRVGSELHVYTKAK
jgi:hypothetical protein